MFCFKSMKWIEIHTQIVHKPTLFIVLDSFKVNQKPPWNRLKKSIGGEET